MKMLSMIYEIEENGEKIDTLTNKNKELKKELEKLLEENSETIGKELAFKLHWQHQVGTKTIAKMLKMNIYQLSESHILDTTTNANCNVCNSILTVKNLNDLKRRQEEKDFTCNDCKKKIDNQRQTQANEQYKKDELEKQKRLFYLKTMPYKEYLETDEWKLKRKDALIRANYKCQLCNQSGALNVHHRTYERRGNELIKDLIVLCSKCHSKFHDILKA